MENLSLQGNEKGEHVSLYYWMVLHEDYGDIKQQKWYKVQTQMDAHSGHKMCAELFDVSGFTV